MLTRLKKTINPVDSDIDHILANPKKRIITKEELTNVPIQNGISKKLLMVEPTNFFSNTETKGDNAFMQELPGVNLQELALLEFNSFTQLLKQFNVELETGKQKHATAADSIFLNNWFSTHKNEYFPDGLLIIYPVKAPTRRLEKTPELIELLRKEYKDFVDLSYLEKENEFLESTGSLIFDHNNRKVYCCYSDRATVKAVNTCMETLNKFSKLPFELIPFKALDQNGRTIYHTNCMMAILEHHTIICLSSIKDESERLKVRELIAENRKIIEISYKQMEHFCANVINVKNKEGKTVLIMSQTAKKNFTKKQISTLSNNYKILATSIPTIEKIGGGSARCMVAEIF
jgi:hypothetical protein